MELQSFHNKEEVKSKLLIQLKKHFDADEIIKGKYWEGGKGCAVGCTIYSNDHTLYEKNLGLPEWLARLEDRIFEGMSNEKAKQFPIDFIAAIPIGINLNKVKWRFCAYLCQ
jgi:hypothetical protein